MTNKLEVQFRNNRLEQLMKETFKDEHLGKVLKYLDVGWPRNIAEGGEI